MWSLGFMYLSIQSGNKVESWKTYDDIYRECYLNIINFKKTKNKKGRVKIQLDENVKWATVLTILAKYIYIF